MQPLSEAEIDRYIQNAITWAQSRLGETGYSSRCLAFVEDAYEKSSGIEIFGGDCASDSAEIYHAAQNTGEPPRGAFVFYNCEGKLFDQYKNWGHVGLSLGEGKVIHAWDRVRMDEFRAMEDLPAPEGWSRLTYVGWCSAGRALQGYRVRM